MEESSNEPIPMTLIHCQNSLFTNPHDLLSLSPPSDRRGAFSHLGVTYEGLESSRHADFRYTIHPFVAGQYVFMREKVEKYNHLTVKFGCERSWSRAMINLLEFDTSYFMRNQIKEVLEIEFIDESVTPPKKEVIAKHLRLEGNSKKTVPISSIYATKINLKLTEGGLTRFRAYGKLMGSIDQGEDLLIGAKIWKCSDNSYGDGSLVLRQEREGKVMAGWETCRHSWGHFLGISLAAESIITHIQIDTYLHRLNNFQMLGILGTKVDAEVPSEVSVDVLNKNLPNWRVKYPNVAGGEYVDVEFDQLNDFMDKVDEKYGETSSYYNDGNATWEKVLNYKSLKPDTLQEYFENDLKRKESVTHLLLLGIPDGGLHRIGLYGKKVIKNN